MKRALFIMKYREGGDYDGYSEWGDYTGSQPLSGGLANSAGMVVKALTANGVEAKLVHVVDNNQIHKEVVHFKADTVFIEAFWVVPEKFAELKKVLPHVKWVVRNHSETPFLANEGIAFGWTLDYLKQHVTIACNAPRMAMETTMLADAAGLNEKYVHYLPNFYIPKMADLMPRVNDNYFDVGCFGAIRPLKNHLEQAIGALFAARALGKKLRFHINGSRIEGKGDPIKKNLVELFAKLKDAELVQHEWKPHDDFLDVIGEMDVVTQVSFSETFNIVAADAVSQYVPVIGSKEIPWLDCRFHADPTSSLDIAEKMLYAYKFDNDPGEINPNLLALYKYNEESLKLWLKFLK